MRLIADSGSSKTDWALLSNTKEILWQTTTLGLNPMVVSAEFITKELVHNKHLLTLREQPLDLYFYGAGCGTEQGNSRLSAVFRAVFLQLKTLRIGNDVEAAAYALYQGKPMYAAILGTGSNACFFDGKQLRFDTPSLGYLLGDEGSGNYFGKRLLRAYYYKELPAKIALDFEQEYKAELPQLISQIYQHTRPNAFLASFMPFVVRHQSHSFFNEMLVEGFTRFLDVYTTQNRTTEICCVGSVGYLCQDALAQAVAHCELTLGRVIQKPIEGLLMHYTIG